MCLREVTAVLKQLHITLDSCLPCLNQALTTHLKFLFITTAKKIPKHTTITNYNLSYDFHSLPSSAEKNLS